jgi:hypothetical protein
MNGHAPDKGAEVFYASVLHFLNKIKIPFMIGGTHAVKKYTGIERETKDMDIFCKAGDYPRILNLCSKNGFKIGIEDDRWLAKIYQGKYYIDLIWGSGNVVMPVSDSWFEGAPVVNLFGAKVPLIPPDELIWAKSFVQDRYKYDGADIQHLILIKHDMINWRRLLSRMEPYWEVLLVHLLNFRFVYPSERHIIPKWLIKELVSRLEAQLDAPHPKKKACRGRLFSRSDYEIDLNKWGFEDIVSE